MVTVHVSVNVSVVTISTQYIIMLPAGGELPAWSVWGRGAAKKEREGECRK